MDKKELNKQTAQAVEAWLNDNIKLEFLNTSSKWEGCDDISDCDTFPHRIKPEPDLDELHKNIMTKWVKKEGWSNFRKCYICNLNNNYWFVGLDVPFDIKYFTDAEFSDCPPRESK